jgi:restriction system protein
MKLHNSTSKDKLPRSRALAAKVVFAALQILKEKGGQAPGRDVVAEVERRVALDEWAKATYEKSGHIRWQSLLHFFSIDAIKAGYLVKKKGVWYLTPEGEKALNLGEVGLHKAAGAAYQKWREANQPSEETEDQGVSKEGQQGQEATIHEIEQLAIEGLKKQIGVKNAYEFQELVAALLRGMGYHTPFVAPKGKDGGIDVIAYRDPLGTVSPRIKVQIKHRLEIPASVQEVRQLMGLLQKDGDVGMFVSSGAFSPDAKTTARGSHVHVELVDLDRFITLWQEFYHKLTDEDKSLLPLVPLYFYAPSV